MKKFDWSDTPSQFAFPVAKAGYSFIFASAFVTLVFALLGLTALSILGISITFFICYFFRDPDRVIPRMEKALVSPADGKVIAVKELHECEYLDSPCTKVSIFMSVFNVHVNRIPYEGTIEKIEYFPGKFFSANLDKASKENEHNAVYLKCQNGPQICFVQIAGLIARRIICKVQKGDSVIKGQRFGMICFGSRVDLYLPSPFTATVAVGEKVTAGTSVLGEFKQ